MKGLPILFSAPMVIANRRKVDPKTITRRVMKDAPTIVVDGKPYRPQVYAREPYIVGGPFGRTPHTPIRCPYGAPGDHLWVRERQRVVAFDPGERRIQVRYEADGVQSHWLSYPERLATPKVGKCLAYGGPRETSRVDLEVTAVRVERLLDITEEDARAEGVEPDFGNANTSAGRDYRRSFERLWDLINGERAAWASNPWVWVVTYKLLRGGL